MRAVRGGHSVSFAGALATGAALGTRACALGAAGPGLAASRDFEPPRKNAAAPATPSAATAPITSPAFERGAGLTWVFALDPPVVLVAARTSTEGGASSVGAVSTLRGTAGARL